MKFLKLFEDIYDNTERKIDEESNRRDRIMSEYQYYTVQDGVAIDKIAEMLDNIETIEDYDDLIFNEDINLEMGNLVEKIIDGAISQDMNEYISDDIWIKLVYKKMPSTVSEKISDLVYEIKNLWSNGKNPFFDYVTVIVANELFKHFEDKLLELLDLFVENEPTDLDKFMKNRFPNVSDEVFNEFMNKFYSNHPEIRRGKSSGLLDTKIKN